MKLRTLLLCAVGMISTHTYAQTACTATVAATPTRSIFGNPVSLTVTVQGAPGANFYRITQANGTPLVPQSIPISPAIGIVGTATLSATLPNANSVPVLPALPTNNEQAQTISVALINSSVSPDPIACTVTPAQITIRKLPTATLLTGPDANSSFVASVYSTQSIPASGTVTFRANGNVLGTGPITLSAAETDFNTRTATYTPATALQPGTYNVTAEFDGDTNLLKSRSDERTFTLGPDTTPDDFQFATQTGAALGASVQSNTVTITGINAAVAVSVTGGTVSIGGAAFGNAGSLTNGQTVRLQVATPCTANTTTSATVTVGTVNRTFTVTTSNTGGAVGGADTDGDGIPDSVECQNGTNLGAKDNNIFGADQASLTRYVQQMYRDFLAREADATGLGFWTGRINRGEATRFDLLSSFIFSTEYQAAIKPTALAFLDANMLTRTNENAAVFVYAAYRSLLGRNPDAVGYNFWYNALTTGGRPLTDVLAEFYYASEYGLRFLPAGQQPARCVGTVGYAPTTYNAAQGTVGVIVTRSSAVGACSAEAVLCTGATCGTTVASSNYSTAGFSGDPLRQLVQFADGQASQTVSVTVSNPIASSATVLRLTLQNPSWGGLTISGSNAATIAFRTASSACEWGADINGNCTPEPRPQRTDANGIPLPSEIGQGNCFSDGTGPCGSYQIARTNCPSDVTSAWQHNTVIPAQSAGSPLNYGRRKDFFLQPGQALMFRFKTNTIPGLQGNIGTNNFSSGEAAKHVVISETPCDFNAQRTVAGDVCSMTVQGDVGGAIPYVVSNTPVAGSCTLKTNTHYYISFRHEDARDTARNGVSRDDCAVRGQAACGSLLNLGGVQP
jgi:hypothetical protein